MIREELKQLPTGPRELRKFGLLVGGVFLLIGLWLLYRHKAAGPYFAAPGAALILVGLVAPRALRPVYLAWMALALVLGIVMSTVLLTLFFFLVITPIGLVARLFGQDFLSQRLEPKAASYWRVRPAAKLKIAADYEKQY